MVTTNDNYSKKDKINTAVSMLNKDIFIQNIIDQIYDYKHDHQLSFAQVAERANLTRQTLRNLVIVKGMPNGYTLYKLIRFLKFKPKEIFK